jgi:hypothetical protein
VWDSIVLMYLADSSGEGKVETVIHKLMISSMVHPRLGYMIIHIVNGSISVPNFMPHLDLCYPRAGKDSQYHTDLISTLVVGVDVNLSVEHACESIRVQCCAWQAHTHLTWIWSLCSPLARGHFVSRSLHF